MSSTSSVLPCGQCGHVHDVPLKHECGHHDDGPCLCESYKPFQWIWHSNYWDGPLSGMVRMPDGRELWANFIPDHSSDRIECHYRTFGVYALTPEQDARERFVHSEFQRLVGYNSDHWHPTQALHGDPAKRAEFYQKYGTEERRREHDAFPLNPCIGTARILWYDPVEDDEDEDA